MKRMPLAMLMLVAAIPLTAHADDTSISGKAMKDHPGTMGGTTTSPNAKPDDSSLSGTEMKQQPGVSDKSGTTSMPNAKPDENSLAGKEMKDAAGAHK